jgi:hypothetical protein
MYSEAIRGALMPFQQLLEEEKAQSEDNMRKAQIQNFLDTHEENRQQLAETTRSHMADEVMKHLGYDLDVRKQGESERHDAASEGLDARRNDLESRRLDITESQHADEEARLAKAEAETEREHKFQDDQTQRENDLKDVQQKALEKQQEAEISKNKALADSVRIENENKIEDDKVVAEVQQWLQHHTAEEIYSSADNPEISQAIDDAYGRMHTQAGRDQLDHLIGGKGAVGQEVRDRKELNNMDGEAKRIFQDNMLKSDPKQPIQTRFNDALSAARRAQGQIEERNGSPPQKNADGSTTPARAGWGNTAIEAYKRAKNAGQSEEDAMAAGRQIQFAITQADKQKPAAAQPNMVKQLFESLYPGDPPKNPGEKTADYEARIDKAKAAAQSEAIRLEKLSREDPDAFNQQWGQSQQPGGKKGKAYDFNQLLTPGTPQPKSDSQKASEDKAYKDNAPPFGGTSTTSDVGGNRLASVGSAIMPSGAPRYSSALSTLSDVLQTAYGPNTPAQTDTGTDQTDQTDQTQLASAIPIHESGHPMPRTPEEAVSLGAGTRFMDPNGTLREVPEYA